MSNYKVTDMIVWLYVVLVISSRVRFWDTRISSNKVICRWKLALLKPLYVVEPKSITIDLISLLKRGSLRSTAVLVLHAE